MAGDLVRCKGCGREVPTGSDEDADGNVCWECVARGEPEPGNVVPEVHYVSDGDTASLNEQTGT